MPAREILGVPLALAALVFLLLALTSPVALVSQANEDATSLQELRIAERQIAVYAKRTGELPTDEALQAWASKRGLTVALSLSTAPLGCLKDFQKPINDSFIVGYWAGEWSECYASPSGATTLRPTVASLLASGLGWDIAVYLLIGLILGWAAWLLMRVKAHSVDEAG